MARKHAPGPRAPIQEFEFGPVHVSIWDNGPDHSIRHHVTFRRLYKDGDEQKEAAAFRTLELPVLVFAADEAYWWLRQREEADKAARGERSEIVQRPNPELVDLFRRSPPPSAEIVKAAMVQLGQNP